MKAQFEVLWEGAKWVLRWWW